MSLFVDRYFSSSNNPFGLDDFGSTSFGRLRQKFTRSGDEREHLPLEMKLKKLKKGSLFKMLTEPGFYDHFESVFHDQGRLPQKSPGKGKEFIIPINIETSRKGENQAPPLAPVNSAASTSSTASNTSPSKDCSGKVIEIPIQVVKESTSDTHKSILREKSRSPILRQTKRTPVVELLTTTTDDARNSQNRDSAGHAVFNCGRFFTKSQTDPKFPAAEPESDIEIVQIDYWDRPTYIGGSLSRKPLHFEKTSAVLAERSLNRAENVKKLTSSKDEGVANNKRSLCGHPRQTTISAPPSYPVYDYLKPILCSQDRQLDYIRGDGNCFFRAISKEVYGTEDYHAECRQAVCDLMRSHPNTFRQYIDHSDVSVHVSDMCKPGTWATTCEIYATATLLGQDVYILAPSPANNDQYHWLLFSPCPLKGSAGQCDEGGCYITLCNTNANHYDRIMPLSGDCNCCLAPPCLNGVSDSVDLTSFDQESERNSLCGGL